MTIEWWWLMLNEALGWNKTGFVTPHTATEVWHVVMGIYTMHKGYARWHGIELNAALWGQTFGIITVAGGFSLFAIAQRYHIVIPDQLVAGMVGVILNMGGWNAFKIIQRKRSKQNEHNGTQDNRQQNNAPPAP